MQCTYKKSYESTCTRAAISDRGLCIFHEEWERKSKEETEEIFYKEIKEGIKDFEGCILPAVDLVNTIIKGDAWFKGATIKGDASFNGATIKGYASFNGATIEGSASFNGATIEGSAWFEGATIKGGASFEGATITGDAWFKGATITGGASFNGATIKRNAWFKGATIEGGASFEGATIEGGASFEGATITGGASFNGATIKGEAWFAGATIEGSALFGEATIEGIAWFNGATIKGDAWFAGATIKGDAFFVGATIWGGASFEGATIKGYASFVSANIYSLYLMTTTFHNMEVQEEACRAAKITQDRVGNRELADSHFYREMEAKRKQKSRLKQWLEIPVQYVFGYGVRPFWVIRSWLLVILAFALVYWLGDGIGKDMSFWQNLYFSVVTAATPGYGGFTPNPGYIVLASFQAIFGTFMWAAIIATFARKFMR